MPVGNVIGEALVEIRPELSKLFRETNEGVSKAVDEAAKKQQSSFDKVSKVGQAAFVGLGTAAVGFGAVAVKAALEGEKAHALLEAAVRASGSTMEGFEPKVEHLSASMAKLGFVNDEVESGLARLTQITQSPTRALELMGVTADLARARHIGLEQAANLVGRAAEGNVTALKRMGVEIQTTGDKAKDGEAAIAELQKRFGGAAQAEAGTYAGKLAAFRAEVSNLEERIGNALLPVLAKAAGGLASTVDLFEHNRAAAIALGAVIGGPLTVAISAYLAKQTLLIASKLADFFDTVGIQALYAKDAIAGTVESMGGMAAATASVLGPLALLGVGLALAQRQAEQVKETGSHFVDGYIKQLGGLSNQTLPAAQAELKTLHDGMKGMGDIADVATGSHSKLIKQIEANSTKYKALKKAIDDYQVGQQGAKAATEQSGQALGDEGDKAGQLGVNLKDLADKLGLSAERTQQLADKLGIDLAKATDADSDKIAILNDRLQIGSANSLALSDAMAKMADKTADATEKASAFDTALERLVGGNIDAEKALVNFENAVDGLSAKIKANAANFDVHTKAGRDDITMVEDAVTSINSHVEAMQRQGFTADQIKQAFAGDTEELRKQLEQTGLTKAQVDKLLTSYGLVPSSINTVVTAVTTDAQKAWNDLMAAAQPYLDLLSKLPAADIKGAASGITVPHFAAGGWVPGSPGQPVPAIVHAGEFVLSRDMLTGARAPTAAVATAPAVAGIGHGVNIEHLVVQEAAGAFQTGVEVARQLRAEVYRRTGR